MLYLNLSRYLPITWTIHYTIYIPTYCISHFLTAPISLNLENLQQGVKKFWDFYEQREGKTQEEEKRKTEEGSWERKGKTYNLKEKKKTKN